MTTSKIKILSVLLILFCASFLTFGQAKPVFSKVVFDSTIDGEFFRQVEGDNISSSGAGTTVVTNLKTGKTDTIRSVGMVTADINCQIDDTGRMHNGFDNCIAFGYVSTDTIVVQFQNRTIELPRFQQWDRILIHIIGGQFYAEYVFSNKSNYHLEVEGQELKLSKQMIKKGDRVRGIFTLRCKNLKSGPRIPAQLSFRGPFDVVVW